MPRVARRGERESTYQSMAPGRSLLVSLALKTSLSRRWEVVAQYLNQHSNSSSQRVAKEVLSKAKELQNSEQQMKEAAKRLTLQAREKTQANSAEMNPSVRLESKFGVRRGAVLRCRASGVTDRCVPAAPQEMLGLNLSAWSGEEQRLLEQALKTFGPNTVDRWDRIAECLPTRSKKDCIKRYKVRLVRRPERRVLVGV